MGGVRETTEEQLKTVHKTLGLFCGSIQGSCKYGVVMMMKRNVSTWCQTRNSLLVLACLLVFCCNGVWAGGSGSASIGTGYQIYSPRHISAEQVRQHLTQLGMGTVSQLPGTNTLVITAGTEDLKEIKALLSRIDRVKGTIISSGVRTHTLAANKSLTESSDTGMKPLENVDLGRITDANRLARAQAVTEETEASALGQPSADAQVIEALPASVQTEVYEMPEDPNSDKVLKLNLPEKFSVVALLDLAGKELKLTYVYDPKDITGDVTMKVDGRLAGPITVKELYSLLESVLKFKGFVMSRRGNVVTVMPSAKVMEIDPELRLNGGVIEPGDAVMTRVFKLKHIDTASAEGLLKNMSLGMSQVSVAETKTLIVTAYAYRRARIESILNIVDRPGEPKLFRSRQLQYTMAMTLTEKVRGLAEQLGTMDISVTSAPVPTTPQPTKRAGQSEAAYQASLRAWRAKQTSAARTRTAAASRLTGAQPKPDTVYLDADERTNSILMIGKQKQLVVVEDLISTLDVQQQDLRTLRLYKIEYIEAEDVRMKLEEIGIISPRRDMRSSQRLTGGIQPAGSKATTSTARPTTTRTTSPYSRYGDEQELRLDEPQIIVVEPSNSILANATPEQHEQISTILKYVDTDILEREIDYRIYPLENQNPTDMAETLTKLIQDTVQDAENKIQQVVKKTDDDIVIVPDENTFSLIVYANQRNHTWIKNLVETLDKRRPQVLIDVTLVEVTKTDDFTYDLNLIQSFPDLVSTSGLTSAIMPSAVATTETATSLIDRLLNGPDSRDRFVDFQSNSGKGTGFYGDEHINVLLTAMNKKGYGRVLAKPKILVNDNETGTISTSKTSYVETTGSVVPGTVGSTAGPNSGVVQTSTQFDPYDEGITLEITPHISEGDLLRLEMNLNRSDFEIPAGGLSTKAPPVTNASDITTIVTVPDESTIILGGMIKLRQNKGGTKVPILGDLPLVGALFRNVANNDAQQKLYIFVKAEIIRPTDVLAGSSDLERISDQNRLAFERHEAEFQGYQNWPGVAAKQMAPERVLDHR